METGHENMYELEICVPSDHKSKNEIVTFFQTNHLDFTEIACKGYDGGAAYFLLLVAVVANSPALPPLIDFISKLILRKKKKPVVKITMKAKNGDSITIKDIPLEDFINLYNRHK